MLALMLGLGLTGAAVGPPDVSARITQFLNADAAQPAFWGVFVQDVQDGSVYYSYNADKAFLPASNQKILTSAAALTTLGSSYRYRTVMYFDGSVNEDVLEGDLVLRGAGDPTFGSVEAGGGDPLRSWARQLAEMGVKRIEGRIVGDDNTFDNRSYPEGWDVDYITSQASRLIGVSTSGLAYNDNVVEVKIVASSAGSAPEINTRPPGFLEVRNGLTTARRRRGISVNTTRNFGSETILLDGTIPSTYNGTIVMPVTNPTTFAVSTFAGYLREFGVDVAAEVVDIDDLRDFDYDAGTPLFVHVSPPLSQILRVVNKESNNFYAEQVFRTFSRGGSADGGEQRVKELLSRAGASTNGVAVRDGSGLSRKDMITPEAMGKLLAYMYDHAEREAFLASLAEGGEAKSTLRYRLHNIPVRAKTGSLEFVRTLSGYTTTTTGRILAFAVFANNYSAPSYQITQTIDRIVMELASAGASS